MLLQEVVITRSSVCDASSPDASYEDDSYLKQMMTEESARRRMQRKKKQRLISSLSLNNFSDVYSLSNDVLGQGSFGKVMTATNNFTGEEVAVKRISKVESPWFFSREKVLREIDLYYSCRGVPEIIQLLEYFEEEEAFFLIFEKAQGGQLFDHLQGKERLSQDECRDITRDLSRAIAFLHKLGVAHRDLKPENVLCMRKDSPTPVKLCDFDLCSSVVHPAVPTSLLSSPVGSAEYMAPEVVRAFVRCSMDDYQEEDLFPQDSAEEEEEDFTYDKRCDLWSLGVMVYILNTGRMPFRGTCEKGSLCDWESGGECRTCQRTLFASIKAAQIQFPEANNNQHSISKEAKDLILSLLSKDPSQRLAAEDVVSHPWILGQSVHKKRPSKNNNHLPSSMLYHHHEDEYHKSKL